MHGNPVFPCFQIVAHALRFAWCHPKITSLCTPRKNSITGLRLKIFNNRIFLARMPYGDTDLDKAAKWDLNFFAKIKSLGPIRQCWEGAITSCSRAPSALLGKLITWNRVTHTHRLFIRGSFFLSASFLSCLTWPPCCYQRAIRG